MTADELQRIVLRLANQVPVRYWLHYNYPNRAPWLMALRIYPRPWSGARRLIAELGAFGMVRDGNGVFTVARTNPDGTPFDGLP